MNQKVTIDIRKADREDAHELAVVHVKTWQCAYKGQLSDEYLKSLSVAERETRWKEQLSDPHSKALNYVALVDKKIVGFCTIGPNRDGDVDATTGELWGIYIDPDFQGKGVGKTLMKTGIEALKNMGYSRATLWVLESNDSSRKFYEHMGWQVEGRKKIEKRPHGELHELRYITTLI